MIGTKVLERKMMKLSKYNIFHQKYNQYIIFNTFANSIIILTENEIGELQNLEGLNSDTLDIYRNLGIVIEDDVDEFAIMRFDNAYFAANSDYHFRILTTTACNAKCAYCYEQGIPTISMDNDTVGKVIAFIKSTVPLGKNIHIEWFGGEPLVNMEVMVRICEQLTAFGHFFESTMVTNGILLDDEKVDILKRICKLTKTQITLDGLAEVYAVVKGVPPTCFDKVINNISLLANNEITVHVRMNYLDNYAELVSLIKYLGTTLGFNKRVFYYVYPIFEEYKSVSYVIMHKVLELNDLLLVTGLMKKSDLYKFTYRRTRCFATNYNGYTISPDGKLYNCSHVMNEKGLVGTIDSYSPYNANRIRFVDQYVSIQCSDCVLYPLCKGGCRAAELGDAKLNQCVIYKSCVEAVLDRLLDMNDIVEGGLQNDGNS